MTFSNPAGSAAASAGAYVRALLEVLGERDPLAVLAELDGWLDRRFSGVSEAALRRPEAPGKWAAADVVQHLADSELVLGFRMRMVLTEDRPTIQGYDQDKWAGTLRYPDVPLAESRAQLTLWSVPMAPDIPHAQLGPMLQTASASAPMSRVVLVWVSSSLSNSSSSYSPLASISILKACVVRPASNEPSRNVSLR